MSSLWSVPSTRKFYHIETYEIGKNLDTFVCFSSNRSTTSVVRRSDDWIAKKSHWSQEVSNESQTIINPLLAFEILSICDLHSFWLFLVLSSVSLESGGWRSQCSMRFRGKLRTGELGLMVVDYRNYNFGVEAFILEDCDFLTGWDAHNKNLKSSIKGKYGRP